MPGICSTRTQHAEIFLLQIDQSVACPLDWHGSGYYFKVMETEIRVGISGWRYKPWRDDFYPKGLPQKDELAFASRHVQVIEINGTFYSLQRPSSFRSWCEQTPDDFLFTVKGSRYITHILRLKEPEKGLANFLASGILALGDKLGPILWQLPPSFRYDRERIEAFFQALPQDGESASRLARRHGKMKTRADLSPHGIGRIRHALEIRHESFCVPEFINLMRDYDIGSVVSDSAGKFPVIEDVTADFVYVRLHGHEELYTGRYSDTLLRQWNHRARVWRRGEQPGDIHPVGRERPNRKKRDVFIFFDNDAKVNAPKDAARLIEMLTK